MKTITREDLKNAIRTVPNFPKEGIMFKDITTAIKQPDLFQYIINEFYEIYKSAGITKIACVESRGFIIGGALAYKLNAGFVPIRKKGKLPAETYSISYELEYGVDSLEVHKDAFVDGDVVLIHDDLLATGGTAMATYQLLKNFNLKKVYFSFLCELSFLEGRKRFPEDAAVNTLLTF